MTSNPDSQAFQELIASPPEVLEAHLIALDPVPLLLVYTHLSGDESLLEKFRPHIKGAWSFEAEIPHDLQAELRARVAATFKDYATHNRPLPPAPDAALLQRMCDVAVGQTVPSEYLPMVLEELNFGTGDAKSVQWRKPVPAGVMSRYHVLVIGAGYSGLAMAIKLKEAGIPFTVIEKNDDVGGTWYENSYPGVAVDTPNHFYSYSFRTSSDWDHYFAQGPEIINYIRTVYREADIADHMRFEQEVVRAVWDAEGQIWAVTVRRKDAQAKANPQKDAKGQWYWSAVDAHDDAVRRLAALAPDEAQAPACFVPLPSGQSGNGRYAMAGAIVAEASAPGCRQIVRTNWEYFDLTLPRTRPQSLFVRDFGRCVKVAGDTLVSAPVTRWDYPPQGCVQHAQMWREVDWTKIAALVTP